VGVNGDIVVEAWQDLLLRYSEAHRFYHTLDHIGRMLGWLDSTSAGNTSIEFAIWYHDVVYDPRSAQNELLSAEFFRSGMGSHIPPTLASDISRLILATDHRKNPSQADDESLLVDIDLSILGENADVYDRYSRDIRREYEHVPEAAYAEGRRAVLSRFLERPIFTTGPFLTLEAVARDNILREIATLDRTRCKQDVPSNAG
jgi:predicted metal-dependent HD superfamily phosphohydrolase